MASVTSKDIPLEFQMFGELFNFRKKYYTPEDNDEYWRELSDSFDYLCAKYQNKYFEELMRITVKEIENRYRNGIKERNRNEQP